MSQNDHEYRQAIAAYQSGRRREAEAICRRIATSDPRHAASLNLLGVIAFETGRQAEALQCLHQACDLAPWVAEFQNALGGVLAGLGRHQEALECIRRALQLRPHFTAAYNNLGAALEQLQRYNEALAAYQKVLSARPDYPEGLVNFSNTLRKLHRHDEAIAAAKRALDLRPFWPEALNCVGVALLEQQQFGDAAKCFRQVISLRPAFADAHYNLAMALLTHGEFEEGWQEFAWRRDARRVSHVPQPWAAWQNINLTGKTVLIVGEGGLGNVMQFARYITLLAKRGAQVHLHCQRRLISLIQSVAGVSKVVSAEDSPCPVDIRIPLRSLPALFGTTLDTIPASVPYLKPDPVLIARWKSMLSNTDGFRIGVCWQGSQELVHRRNRSFPSSQLMAIAKVPGVKLISVQKQAQADQSLPLITFDEFDEASGGFMDTAAIMANLDLVITCDTSIAHLAGALNVPALIALPFAGDWRWLKNRADSPWYPSVRLYRQPQPGDWQSVFESMESRVRGTVMEKLKSQ